MIVLVDRSTRQVWITGRRCHHGAVGVALATVGLITPNPAGPVLFAVGVALAVHDWADMPWLPARREEECR